MHTGGLWLCRSSNPHGAARRTSVWPATVTVPAILHLLGQEADLVQPLLGTDGLRALLQLSLQAPLGTLTAVTTAKPPACLPCPEALCSPAQSDGGWAEARRPAQPNPGRSAPVRAAAPLGRVTDPGPRTADSLKHCPPPGRVTDPGPGTGDSLQHCPSLGR